MHLLVILSLRVIYKKGELPLKVHPCLLSVFLLLLLIGTLCCLLYMIYLAGLHLHILPHTNIDNNWVESLCEAGQTHLHHFVLLNVFVDGAK